MLQPEDAEAVGLTTMIAPERPKSSVSQMLKKISDELKEETLEWEFNAEAGRDSYQICVAVTRDMRRRAYSLAHRVYAGHGYVPDDSEMVVLPQDAEPDTLTLLAHDRDGRDAATISIVFDGPTGLPADTTYRTQLDELRSNGRRLSEVVRLAIAPEHQRSKSILLRLMNLVYVYARRVKNGDDFIIEVSPRHAHYYNRLLLFEQFGPARPCPRVQDNMGVLLRLQFSQADPLINRYGRNAVAASKTLFPYFYSWFEEGAVAEFMARHQSAMSPADQLYFGLQQPAEATV